MDLVKGLFLTNICYEVNILIFNILVNFNTHTISHSKYILRSKRYMAECINFLSSCLYLAIDKDSRKPSHINQFSLCAILKSFKLVSCSKFDLIPENKVDETNQIDLSIVNRNEEEIRSRELDSFK